MANLKNLYSIPGRNYNWQGVYFCMEYVRLPKGVVGKADLTWNNSDQNPRNSASLPVRVQWGEASYNEMVTITFRALAANEAETDKLHDALRMRVVRTPIWAKIRRMDVEGELEETRGRCVGARERPERTQRRTSRRRTRSRL